MKKILILCIVIHINIKSIDSEIPATIPFPIPNTITYPSTQESNYQYTLETPLENIFTEKIFVNKDDIDNFEFLKNNAIPFLRKESASDPDSSGIQGYFWNMKNHNDKLQYGGIARAEQERYVNVVSVPASTASSRNQTMTMNTQNDATRGQDNSFDPGYLVYIGTYYGKYDGKTYYLYGRYVNTIIPVDPLDTNGNYPVEIV